MQLTYKPTCAFSSKINNLQKR